MSYGLTVIDRHHCAILYDSPGCNNWQLVERIFKIGKTYTCSALASHVAIRTKRSANVALGCWNSKVGHIQRVHSGAFPSYFEPTKCSKMARGLWRKNRMTCVAGDKEAVIYKVCVGGFAKKESVLRACSIINIIRDHDAAETPTSVHTSSTKHITSMSPIIK